MILYLVFCVSTQSFVQVEAVSYAAACRTINGCASLKGK